MKRPLEKWERKYFHALEAYIDLPIPIDSIEIWWDDALTVQNGILGYFKIQKPARVYLQMYNGSIQNNAIHRFWARRLFSTLGHEMQHMKDYRDHPVLYVLNATPFLRRLTIEPRAKEVENNIEKQIRNLGNG